MTAELNRKPTDAAFWTNGTIATICARGGSKGLPGKNLMLLGGKPLIVHSIEHALACASVSGVYVSTDDAEIAAVATQAGALVPYLRPKELATDAAAKIPVIEHLIQHLEAVGIAVRQIVDLQPTSPLRTLQDIEACLSLSRASDCDLVISGYDPGLNPYFTMVERQADGCVALSKPSAYSRRQDAPQVFGMNGSVYVWQRPALARAVNCGIWGLNVKLHVMPRERSIDIDDAFDFELAQWLYQKQHEVAL